MGRPTILLFFSTIYDIPTRRKRKRGILAPFY